MAARTAKFFAAAKIMQMGCVIKGNPVEIHFASQQPRFVAARSEATGVGHFGGGPRALGGSDVLGQLHQSQHLAAYLLAHSRWKMAFHARDVTMRRFFPGHVIRFHIVARAAELRPRSVDAGEGSQECRNKEERTQNSHDSERPNAKFLPSRCRLSGRLASISRRLDRFRSTGKPSSSFGVIVHFPLISPTKPCSATPNRQSPTANNNAAARNVSQRRLRDGVGGASRQSRWLLQVEQRIPDDVPGDVLRSLALSPLTGRSEISPAENACGRSETRTESSLPVPPAQRE